MSNQIVMSDDEIRIFPLGDTALTVEFGNVIAVDLNRTAVALSEYFEKAPFPGFIESVPAFGSTTIFYDLGACRRQFPGTSTIFSEIKRLVLDALASLEAPDANEQRRVEIPVCFDKESALDLEYISQIQRVPIERIIEIFIAGEYRVYMLGFLPGFAYMGEVDERIALPRKETPRTSVPKGSVGIAGRQTGIYSLSSPGGWQIIGRTDVEMFRPTEEIPCFLRAGDLVTFTRAK